MKRRGEFFYYFGGGVWMGGWEYYERRCGIGHVEGRCIFLEGRRDGKRKGRGDEG